jgi:PAS domain S-box-containing protein
MSISPNVAVEPGAGPVVAAPFARASILVIDDEAPVRQALSAMLEADGFGVVAAGSGKEAIEHSRRRHFDLAITDLMMPEMDGLQTMAALKVADPELEVMVLTGQGGMDSAVEALRQGACDYLLKPLTMTQLCAGVEAALERRTRNIPPLRPASKSFIPKVKGLRRIRHGEAWAYTLALALAMVVTGSFLHFHIGHLYQEATAQWQARQLSIADDRAQRVADWLMERQADAEIISNHPAVLAALQAYHVAGQLPQRPAGAPAELTAALDELASVYYYNGVYVLDADAHLVAQSQYSEPLSPRLAEISRTVARTGALRPEVLRDALGKTLVSFCAPVFSRQEVTAGVPITNQPRETVVLVVDAAQTLFPILTHESMPTRTGEALLVRRDGDDTVCFSPLRHRPAGSPNLRFPLTTTPLAARTALEGRETFMEYKDYRGVPVLAATRYIPSAGWGLVNKIDSAEAYENVRHMAVAEELAAGLLLILLGGLLAHHRRTTLMRALKQQESEFRALLESAPDAMAITDGEGHIVLVNAQAEILFGFNRQELMGRPLGMLFPEWAPERSGEGDSYNFSKVVARHAGKTIEMRGLRKGGREFPSEVRLSPVKEVEGGLFSCGIRDITERKQAEKALSEAEEQFHSLFASIPLPTFLFDAETLQYLEVNAAAVSISGYSRDEFLHMRVVDLSTQENENHIVSQIQALHPQSLVRSEGRYRLKDGRIVDVESDLRILDFRGRRAVLSVSQEITARKQVESALRESEDRYRDLVENSFVLIGTHDAKGRILSVNRAAATLLEATNAEELAGRPLTDYVPPDLLPQFDEYLKTILREGHAEGLMVLTTPSGKTKIAEYRNTLRRQDPNEPIVRWTSQDVTERIQAEKAQAFLASLVESSQDAIIGKTLEGIIVSWNHGAEELYGYRAEEVVGKCISILAPPDRMDEISQLLEKARQGESISRCETVRVRKDGRLVDVSLTISPVRDGTGKITGVVTTARDITERKRAEKALEERTAYLNTLIQISPLGIVVLDTEERIQMSNPAFEKLFLYSRQEMQGANLNELIVPLELMSEGESLARLCLSVGSVHAASRRRRKDGALVDVEISGVPLVMDGEPRGILGLYQDITERKCAEATMAERHRLATLVADVGVALTGAESLRQGLQRCAEILVRDIDAAFARVWTVSEEEKVLELEASAGMYTHIDGGHARVPIGKFKIGRIAENGELHLTNSVQEDSWVGNPEWARREGMVAFAGYPLKVEERVLGVVAAFARKPLTEATLQAFASVADSLAQFIKRKRAEQALAQERDLLRALMDNSPDYIFFKNPESRFLRTNKAHAKTLGLSDPSQAVRKTDFDFFPIEDAKNYYEDERKVFQTGRPLTGRVESVRQADGEIRWCSTTKVPIRDPQGRITGLVGITRDITEHKRAEEALRESEGKYRVLYESSRDAIMMLAPPEWKFTAGNPAAIDLFGAKDEQEFVAAAPWRLSPEHQPDGALSSVKAPQMIAAAMETGTNFFEWTHRKFSGEEFFATVALTRMIYRGQTILQATVRDITEHKRAEETLQLTQFSMEHASDAIFWMNPQGQIVYVNEAACRSLGRSREELLSLSIPDIDPDVPPEAWKWAWAKVKALGAMNLETHHQTKQGRAFPVEVTSNYLEFGGKEYSFAFARDITERKRAEEETRASEERYRELFENASDIVYTTGLDTRVTSLNRMGQSILGYSAQEATQLDLKQLVVPKHWEIVERSRKRLWAGDADLKFEVEVTRKDGRPMTLEVKPRLIYKGGQPVGVQAIARDITGRDAAEMELRHAQKLESVGRLASGIAHEINTPIQFVGDNTRFLQESFESFQSLLGKYQGLRSALASGSANAELLAEVQRVEEASDCAFLMEEVPRAITQTLEGVDRVATIVRAMKEFAHPEGKEMAAADLNKALLSTLTVARNELKYVADVETAFGELPMVICNVGDMNQVFLNLLVNAAHAIGDVVKGTFAKGNIRVRTQAEGSTVLVTISDTGCGIPEANRPKVFDPFFTTKEVGRGTGQGLAIARTVVVDRHKGALTFESEVGKGTSFYVRLPIDPGECSKETRAP